MYRTNTFNTGENKAAIVHDPGIEPLFTYVESLFTDVESFFNGVNTNVLLVFLTHLYYIPVSCYSNVDGTCTRY